MLTRTNSIEYLQMVCCSVGDETYGLDMSLVKGVQGAEAIRQAREGQHIAGWLPTNRGDVPVVYLSSKLGRRTSFYNPEDQILVLDSAQGPFGLIIDRIRNVVNLTADNLFPLPGLVAGAESLFQGVASIEGEMVLYASAARLHPQAVSTDENLSSGSSPFFSGADKRLTQAVLQAEERMADDPDRKSKGRVLFFSTADFYSSGRPLIFGLSLSQVLEITEPLSIVPVPGAPSYVLGLSNWRNNPVPMIDLNIRLRMGASSRGEGTCFLIVRAPGISDLVGFPIKPDARMQILPLANVPCDRDLPLDRSMTRGIFDLTNATLVVPDMSRIIRV